MSVSLKISNIKGNELELIQRLRGVSSPGKKLLLEALKTSDYTSIYKELLYRIELYTALKVLNYPKNVVNQIVTTITKSGLEALVDACLEKYENVTADLMESEDLNIKLNHLPNVDDVTKPIYTKWFIELVTPIKKMLNDKSFDLEDAVLDYAEYKNFDKYGKKEGKLIVKSLIANLENFKKTANLNESEDYQQFFKNKLEKYGADSPADLTDDEKTDFFNEIESEWTGEKQD